MAFRGPYLLIVVVRVTGLEVERTQNYANSSVYFNSDETLSNKSNIGMKLLKFLHKLTIHNAEILYDVNYAV